MSRFFSVFVIIAILVGGGAYLYNQKAEEEATAAIEKRLRAARRSFAEKARGAITEEENDAYISGVKAALRAYADELKSVVYADRPEAFDVDEMKKTMTTELEAGNISEAQHKGMMERFELVKSAYETLMEGKWEPDLSRVGKGETRLDIFGVRRIRGPDGNPLLEARFFLWGVEPNSRLSFGQLALEYWREDEPDAKTKRQRRRDGRDPDEPVLKVLGRAEGDATPVVFDQKPGKTIAEFPSYVTIGTLWFPQVPREAKLMDLRYQYSVRKGGSENQTDLFWEKMPIPRQWMLEEGETWMADEVEATEEEMAGVDLGADAGVAEEAK